MSEIPSPYGGRNPMKLTREEFIKGIIGMVFFLGLIALYGFEFRHISNTFESKGLVIKALIFGLLFGIGLGYYFSKSLKDSFEQFRMYTFCIILSIVFAPLFASLSNRWLTFSEKEKVQVQLERQNVYIKSRFGKVESKPDGYFLFFYKDQKLERVKTKEVPFPNAKNGDLITINIQKGFWGYDVFYED